MFGIHFDKTITLGNLLTMLSLLVAGFGAYLSIEVRMAAVDHRTFDYILVRDLVKKNDTRLDSLERVVQELAADRRQLTTELGNMSKQLAAMNATLEAIKAR